MKKESCVIFDSSRQYILECPAINITLIKNFQPFHRSEKPTVQQKIIKKHRFHAQTGQHYTRNMQRLRSEYFKILH